MQHAGNIRSKGRYSAKALHIRAVGEAMRHSNFLKGIGLMVVSQLLLTFVSGKQPHMKMYRRKFAVFTR
ncbi:hypothetical protein ORI89_06320 [Sphingobacterium sp. UT-1RO-CII-1]|uniref:hypothetical protein n=1 Tax=Sphingobacterium sp. UT-1RO-CII-1 TaxID=2995225 RepID=UPI00227D03DD|nr:hypothetical protein [Sphingobacterium sp. UT-1RO-CII-1]MCY4779257.1 hypothetical protein [Sphingobacterium sp. UT-1RO-CII-1]